MFNKVFCIQWVINPILYSDLKVLGQRIFQFPDTLKILMNFGSVKTFPKLFFVGTLVNPLERFHKTLSVMPKGFKQWAEQYSKGFQWRSHQKFFWKIDKILTVIAYFRQFLSRLYDQELLLLDYLRLYFPVMSVSIVENYDVTV